MFLYQNLLMILNPGEDLNQLSVHNFLRALYHEVSLQSYIFQEFKTFNVLCICFNPW